MDYFLHEILKFKGVTISLILFKRLIMTCFQYLLMKSMTINLKIITFVDSKSKTYFWFLINS